MKIKLYLCGGESPLSQYPLGLGYLKSNCNADIDIVKDKKDLENCDLIGLSSNAWGIKEAIEILNSVKIPVIIGGQGTLWKGLEKYNFKHIVIGEGERALNKIIEGTNQKVIIESLIENINSLNYPDRGQCGKQVPIFTARGCPFNCYFCSSQKFWRKVRYHSASYFISEVKYLIKTYPQSKILRIYDDLFIADKNRFDEIYELWMKEGFNKKLKPKGCIRSKIFTLEIAKKMKKMGFLRVKFGAESGSNRVLKILNKKATTEDNQRTIDIAKRAKLGVTASFMYGTPGETEKDLELTKQFIKRNKGKFRVEGWYRFKPFPGTKFYNGEDLTKVNMRVR